MPPPQPQFGYPPLQQQYAYPLNVYDQQGIQHMAMQQQTMQQPQMGMQPQMQQSQMLPQYGMQQQMQPKYGIPTMQQQPLMQLNGAGHQVSWEFRLSLSLSLSPLLFGP